MLSALIAFLRLRPMHTTPLDLAVVEKKLAVPDFEWVSIEAQRNHPLLKPMEIDFARGLSPEAVVSRRLEIDSTEQLR